MKTIRSQDAAVNPARGTVQSGIRRALNDTSLQLSVLQRRVGARLDLKDTDLECYNLVFAEGSMSPRDLAQRSGIHPATLTGVIDRLERAGWVARERDPADRRGVRVVALRDRNRELFDLLAGMNTAMGELMDDFTTEELQTILDFLTRTVAAGAAAADELAAQP
jgi:DNA-binding MarR family transcriptional regulator